MAIYNLAFDLRTQRFRRPTGPLAMCGCVFFVLLHLDLMEGFPSLGAVLVQVLYMVHLYVRVESSDSVQKLWIALMSNEKDCNWDCAYPPRNRII